MNKGQPDYILLAVTIILILLGILVIASASAYVAQEQFQKPYYYLVHQILYGLLPGIILGFLAFKISLNFLKKLAAILLLINLVLLALVFLPGLGFHYAGASRWVKLGPLIFQPSEFLKITFILYLAALFSSENWQRISFRSREKTQKSLKMLAVFFLILGIVGLLLALQPDISTLGIIVLTGILVYFAARTPLWHSFLIIMIGIGTFLFLIKIASYRFARILVFLKPETDPMGIGYQVKQALITVGSGGLFGQGLGMSRQKFGFLPQAMGDSIFAIFAEEAGFLGALILISLFLIFIWRGVKISKEAQDGFSRPLGLGITSWLGLQAILNISSQIGIFPLSGVPLPFLSYGGSALITELVGVGLLLNISKASYKL